MKKLHVYNCERWKKAKDLNEDNVESIKFPNEGITLHWKTKEIVHYLMEYKNIKSPLKASPRNKSFNISKIYPLFAADNNMSHCTLCYKLVKIFNSYLLYFLMML